MELAAKLDFSCTDERPLRVRFYPPVSSTLTVGLDIGVIAPWQAPTIGLLELHNGVVGFRSALVGAAMRGEESMPE
jgi:hypothetical protein